MSLKVDEMWAVKNNLVGYGGWAAVAVEDAVTGEIIAFVFGPVRRCRRTHQTFRHLLYLLEEATIEVIRWITDSWCRAAVAGLL